jgi:hypothetical protein
MGGVRLRLASGAGRALRQALKPRLRDSPTITKTIRVPRSGIAGLPLAEQQGRLGVVTREADRPTAP